MANNKVQIEVVETEIMIQLKNMIQALTEEVKNLREKIENKNNSTEKMNRAEVAEQLGISWGMVESISFIKGEGSPLKNTKKILPCSKVGNRFFYEREDVEKAKLKLGL